MIKQCIVCCKELTVTNTYCTAVDSVCLVMLEPIPPQELGFNEYEYQKGTSSYSKYWTNQPLKVKR